MARKGIEAFNFTYSFVTVFIFIGIIAFNSFNLTRVGYNRETLILYIILAIVSLIFTIFFIIFNTANFLKKRTDGRDIPFRAGHVSETSDLNPLSQTLIRKLTPHIIWSIIIILATTGFGLQVWQQPDVYSNIVEFSASEGIRSQGALQFGIARSLFDVGVTPGYTEDMISFTISAFFVVIILLIQQLMFRITKFEFFRFNRAWYIGAFFIGSFIGALGLGFVPGFAQAHEQVGGQNTAFLIATFIFQWINLLVFWFTGLFLPLAHIIHNGLFVIGFSVALSVGLFYVFPFISRARKHGFKKTYQIEKYYIHKVYRSSMNFIISKIAVR